MTPPPEAGRDGSPGAASGAASGAVGVAPARQVALFRVGGERYAVDLGRLSEIVSIPSTVRVPLAPRTLSGLANLRGTVLPVLDLAEALGLAARTDASGTQIMVCRAPEAIGLTVDRIEAVRSVEASAVEPLAAAEDGSLVDGVLRTDDGALHLCLDVDALLARTRAEVVTVATRARRTRPTGPRRAAPPPPAAPTGSWAKTRRMVGFGIGATACALPIDGVQEIMALPETPLRLPDASTEMAGLVHLRGGLVAMLDLAAVLGTGAGTDTGTDTGAGATGGFLVVVRVPDEPRPLGLVASAIHGILDVDPDRIETALARRACLPAAEVFSGVARVGEDDRIVGLLDLAALVSDGRRAAIAAALGAARDAEAPPVLTARPDGPDTPSDRNLAMPTPPDAPATHQIQIVVFRLCGAEYGVPIAAMREILPVPERLTRVPRAPDALEGLMNLRGSILSVIDLRRRLGLGGTRPEDAQIVVLETGATQTGFIVDAAVEVLRAPASAVRPGVGEDGAEAGPVRHVLNLDDGTGGRMILLLDPAALVEGTAQVAEAEV